jgi:hypothetical protein
MSAGIFTYQPDDHESEKASNSYVMSLIAIMAGFPLPIINLLATFFFWMGNRKGTFFVRWHCMQALLSQVIVLCINSTGFYWTLSIIFGPNHISNSYIAYIITAFLFNLTDFIGTIITASKTRKGEHISWWLFGDLTNLLIKE